MGNVYFTALRQLPSSFPFYIPFLCDIALLQRINQHLNKVEMRVATKPATLTTPKPHLCEHNSKHSRKRNIEFPSIPPARAPTPGASPAARGVLVLPFCSLCPPALLVDWSFRTDLGGCSIRQFTRKGRNAKRKWKHEIWQLYSETRVEDVGSDELRQR